MAYSREFLAIPTTFVFESFNKKAPPRVLNRLRETVVLKQVFRLQILDTNQVVVFDQDRAEFLGEILALIRDFLVNSGNLLFRFQVVFHGFGVHTPFFGATFPTLQNPLGFREFFLLHAVEARIFDFLTRGEDRELFESEVNADGGARFRERVDLLLNEDGSEEVSRSLAPNRHVDNSSHRITCVLHLHEPEFWKTDFVAFDPNIIFPFRKFRRVRLDGIGFLFELRLLILPRKETFVPIVKIFEGGLQSDAVHLFEKVRSFSVPKFWEHRRTVAMSHGLARLLVGVLREREEVVVDESGAPERFDNQFLLILRRVDSIPIGFVGEHACTPFQHLPLVYQIHYNYNRNFVDLQ